MNLEERIAALEEELSKKNSKTKKKKDKNKKEVELGVLAEIKEFMLSQKQQSPALELMYNDELSSAMSIDGFKEYIESDDEYGNSRKEQLDKLPLENKVKAIRSMKERFQSASGNSVGGAVGSAIEKKQEKVALNFQEKYKEVAEKYRNKGHASEFNEEIDKLIYKEVQARLNLG